MTKMLKIDKTVSDGTRDFLRFLLESKKVRGVAVLTKEGKSGCVSYSLITDPEKMAEAVPFYPVMPQNAGKAGQFGQCHNNQFGLCGSLSFENNCS